MSQREEPFALDVRAQRRGLAAAVESHEGAAVLQREVTARLLERLDFIRLDPADILELGCGPGGNTRALRRRYPKARQVGLELVPGMARAARRRSPWRRRLQAVSAGYEQLPFAGDSFDLVFSSLALHRSRDLRTTVRELQRILRPGGVLMFATYGPDTLDELRAAWAAADPHVHVQRFVDMHDIGDALVGARLADPVMDMEHFTLTYPNLRGLVADLRALGERNVLRGRNPGLTTPRRWRRMEAAYEMRRDADGRLPATWEIAYGHAWGTDAQPQTHGPEGEVRVALGGVSIPRRGRGDGPRTEPGARGGGR
ncbi:methyltransferase domain-containing protein [Spiribacter halobius]|uniref:Malonyl-[acyl-carrier protein] O-methyltransferase n=1 Tax=Sediminicurvatus halobius TaxID=2182432 RepID=A0A2U2MYD8_9GAMM|nr:methyltransferase domain-containing protein [Spiribacter halobius]PWG61946.1 malonyl-[acyl-carrier protein] O-methyltransferase BioC [Spiribacter halobius]UEX78354.1 methyltransferase domain-containing protein [Spiribacter halobius]